MIYYKWTQHAVIEDFYTLYESCKHTASLP